MEDFTLPSVGVGQASKNGGAIHPFFQNAMPSPNFLIIPKKKLKILKNFKKEKRRAAV
jgi:hypothetical protein